MIFSLVLAVQPVCNESVTGVPHERKTPASRVHIPCRKTTPNGATSFPKPNTRSHAARPPSARSPALLGSLGTAASTIAYAAAPRYSNRTPKFDAGCGWPSYFKPLNGEVIEEKTDHAHGMLRIEVRCKNCGAHLGHVSRTAPAPPRACGTASIRLRYNSSLSSHASPAPSRVPHASPLPEFPARQ